MTILMINPLSMLLEALIDLYEFARGRPEPPKGQSLAVCLACAVVVSILVHWRFGDRILKFIHEWNELSRQSQLERTTREWNRREQRERERTSFYVQSWARKEAALVLKKYHRELERRKNFDRPNMPDLSEEEIHQRIDYLEALDFEPKKKELTLSLADRRIACRIRHREEKEKELQYALSDTFSDDAERAQKVKEIHNHWNARERKALQDMESKERNDNVTT